MMWGYGFTWGGMLLMSLSMLVWFAVLAVAIWALVRWLGGRAPASGAPLSGPSAMEILRQRYARGEIDATTFEQMREQLKASGVRDE
jgi:putative membrane protein